MTTSLFPPLADFQLALPRQVRFGWGELNRLPDVAATLAKRVWVISGSRHLNSRGVIEEVMQQLRQRGLCCELLTTISREPLVEDVDHVSQMLREQTIGAGDLLLAIGGGSAIDLAKGCAAMATNRHGESVSDFLEGVGRGLKIEVPPLPIIAVPTTSGTGTEATRNGVITSRDPLFKKSLRDHRLLPEAVILDPELTLSLPSDITAQTGLDALTQLIESFLSNRTNPFTAALCREGLSRAFQALPMVVRDGSDRVARTAMMYAAFLSGMALANSGLGMAHGIAAALGVHANIPHGLACACLLPLAMRSNLDCRTSELAELGLLFVGHSTGSDRDDALAGIEAIESLCQTIGIPSSLHELGIPREQLPAIAHSSPGNSLSGNPRFLTETDVFQLLSATYPRTDSWN
ncbi:MAG: iron-containing alcohol dehydrogenase [Planctomycetaceae bacterium]